MDHGLGPFERRGALLVCPEKTVKRFRPHTSFPARPWWCWLRATATRTVFRWQPHSAAESEQETKAGTRHQWQQFVCQSRCCGNCQSTEWTRIWRVRL